MSRRILQVVLPEASGSRLEVREGDAGLVLSEWLAKNGHELNTRCGGRGQCRGCRVQLEGGENPRTVKACRMLLGDVGEAVTTIRIPETSVPNRSLNGVSLFELRTTPPSPVPGRSGVGVALDIGTTTLAGALWDLGRGTCLATASRANGQARYGDNVLARISHAVEKAEGVRELQDSLVRGSLWPLVEELCAKAGIEPSELVCGTAAGNTVMLHTLVGASLGGLSQYPFRPEFLGEREEGAAELGLPGDYKLRMLPGLGAFVGADISSGAIAAGMDDDAGPVLLIDYGTNGEILLKAQGRYFATATAAGPAFEGGRLNCGAPARRGVISSLDYGDQGWVVTMPKGSCGDGAGISGAAYVDFMALGRRHGLLNRFGRFQGDSALAGFVRDNEDGDRCCYVTDKLFVSEADVAELIQAKGAIGGGVCTLLEEAGLAMEDLATVLIAGGFGYHLNPEHAMAIGLVPEVARERIRIVGNASLGGASLALLAGTGERLAAVREQTTLVELNQTDSFEDHYTDALCLEPMGE